MKIIIPARLQSRRLPNKPLININGKPLIVRVAENAKKSKHPVYVASADSQIIDTCKEFNINFIKTPECFSGTERVFEAAKQLKDNDSEIFINLQGDCPDIHISKFTENTSLIYYFPNNILTAHYLTYDIEKAQDPNNTKVVTQNNTKCLYFSRSAIPYASQKYKIHIGVYAYSYNTLKNIYNFNTQYSSENLEQLAWLENQYTINCIKLPPCHNIDTKKDLKDYKNSL